MKTGRRAPGAIKSLRMLGDVGNALAMGLPVVYTSGISQLAGDAISFGFIGISEIVRSLP